MMYRRQRQEIRMKIRDLSLVLKTVVRIKGKNHSSHWAWKSTKTMKAKKTWRRVFPGVDDEENLIELKDRRREKPANTKF